MKILFLTHHLAQTLMGARTLAKARYEMLCQTIGKENVVLYSVKAYSNATQTEYESKVTVRNKWEILFNVAAGRPYLINKESMEEIVSLAKQCDVVFIDNYNLGHVARLIKKRTNCKVYLGFHGVYAVEGRQIRKHDGSRKLLPRILFSNTLRGEQVGIRYADHLVALNQRDAGQLQSVYQVQPDFILPMIIKDTARIESLPYDETRFSILFVGGSMYPNVEGIRWFAQNVMPQLNKKFHLFVVGCGMEIMGDEPCMQKDNVHVVGTVDDLSEWYNRADVVVGPIFSGNGMKTKTAEALMYGKMYLGTSEALCGYDAMEPYLCDTAEAFVTRLTQCDQTRHGKYYEEMRELFLTYYSTKSNGERLKQFMERD